MLTQHGDGSGSRAAVLHAPRRPPPAAELNEQRTDARGVDAQGLRCALDLVLSGNALHFNA